MGFCGGCGEIIGRTGRCTSCDSGVGAVNPVSGTNDPALAKAFDYDGHAAAPTQYERRGSINNVWSKPCGGGWQTGEPGETNRNCAGCGQRLDPLTMVHACDRDWHEACFVCGVCAKPLADSPFINKGGVPYHKKCHASASAAACAKVGVALRTTGDGPLHTARCTLPAAHCPLHTDLPVPCAASAWRRSRARSSRWMARSSTRRASRAPLAHRPSIPATISSHANRTAARVRPLPRAASGQRQPPPPSVPAGSRERTRP